MILIKKKKKEILNNLSLYFVMTFTIFGIMIVHYDIDIDMLFIFINYH